MRLDDDNLIKHRKDLLLTLDLALITLLAINRGSLLDLLLQFLNNPHKGLTIDLRVEGGSVLVGQLGSDLVPLLHSDHSEVLLLDLLRK